MAAGLASLDQLVKMLVLHVGISGVSIVGRHIYISPKLNTQLSMYNSLFGFALGAPFLIAINAGLILAAAGLLLYACRKQIKLGRAGACAADFLQAGLWASLIDKIFWGGSYDWLCVDIPVFPARYFFDLKDLYMDIGAVLLCVFLVSNLRKQRSEQ